jgi:hypothetical protein
MTTHEKALQKLVEQQEKMIDHLLAQLDLLAHPVWGVRLKDPNTDPPSWQPTNTESSTA